MTILAAVPRPTLARRVARVGLAAYAALLGVALLAPTSVTQSAMAAWIGGLGRAAGLPAYVTVQPHVELICNALIVAPVVAAASLLRPRVPWWAWTGATCAVSCLVEATQGTLLPDRTPSLADVAANTVGGLLGALAAAALTRRCRRPRPR